MLPSSSSSLLLVRMPAPGSGLGSSQVGRGDRTTRGHASTLQEIKLPSCLNISHPDHDNLPWPYVTSGIRDETNSQNNIDLSHKILAITYLLTFSQLFIDI